MSDRAISSPCRTRQTVRMDEGTPATPLPSVIGRYFDAHDRRDTDAALSAFARDATVGDDGREYSGLEEIREWIAAASTQFTYTRTLLDASAQESNRWLVRNRLDGDFPGGVVELRYEFTLDDDLIAELVIEP